MQYSYEEQRMLCQYQTHQSSNQHQTPDQLLEHYCKLIDQAQQKIKLILYLILIPCIFTMITTFICILEPQMAGVEFSKFFSHILSMLLFFRILRELMYAKKEILEAPKEYLKLLCLSYEKSVYDFLEEFKFQEKFDLLNVLVYSCQICSFCFNQMIFLIQLNKNGIYYILMISYIIHMILNVMGCLISWFRQNPNHCNCSLLKTKTSYQFIYLPNLLQTKKRTLILTGFLFIYYSLKLAVFSTSFYYAEKETTIVLYVNIGYCILMIIQQIYQYKLAKMIKKVNSRHLECFQNAYMLIFKLFFYESAFNKLLKTLIFLSSCICIIVCLIFNVNNYIDYIQESIYKIEVYIVNDTIAFLICMIIYLYYMMKKYTNKSHLDHLEYQDRQDFQMIFYQLESNQKILNPYYTALHRYIELEQQQSVERQHREIVRKIQITSDQLIEFDENLECIICTEILKKDQKLVALQCHNSHIFHKECLVKWVLLHTNCPTCRAQITS